MIKNIFRKISPAILFTLISCSLLQTYGLMKNHFTHGDDIGVAYTFLKEDLFNKACEKNIAKKEARILFSVLGNSKSNFCNFYYYPYIFTVIPRGWTYAPFQFWFTQALLKPDSSYSYTEVKWRGRLPSFLFHTLGLILFYLLLKKKIFNREDEKIIPIILTLLTAFSLEQRIMASQMESYAIGLMSNCFALFGILKLNKISEISRAKLIWLALILAMAIAMQYQALFLVLSGLLAVVIFNTNNRPVWGWLKELIIFCLYFILFLCLTVAILLLRHIGGGLNWNAGPNREFTISATSVYEKILAFESLIWNKSGYNFYSVISAFEINSYFNASLFGILFLVLFLLGFAFLIINRKSSRYRFLFLIFSIYFTFYLGLVFFGRFSFAPTRHFLFFLPPILILVGFGTKLIRPKEYLTNFNDCLISLVMLYAILSLKLFPSFEQKRFDTSQKYNVPTLYSQSGADQMLLDQFDMEPFFMPELINQPIYRYRPNPLCKDYPLLLNPGDLGSIKILWYSKRVLLDANGAPIDVAPYEGGAIKDYFERVFKDCHPNGRFKSDSISLKKISDILIYRNNTEVDLSNLTKNGANQLFLQLFEVQFQNLTD